MNLKLIGGIPQLILYPNLSLPECTGIDVWKQVLKVERYESALAFVGVGLIAASWNTKLKHFQEK